MRLVAAIASREMKAALFLALDGVESIDIVATASSSAELINYCRTFRPDVTIVEDALPGGPLEETLQQLEGCGGRILLLDPSHSIDGNVDTLDDIEGLITTLSNAEL